MSQNFRFNVGKLSKLSIYMYIYENQHQAQGKVTAKTLIDIMRRVYALCHCARVCFPHAAMADGRYVPLVCDFLSMCERNSSWWVFCIFLDLSLCMYYMWLLDYDKKMWNWDKIRLTRIYILYERDKLSIHKHKHSVLALGINSFNWSKNFVSTRRNYILEYILLGETSRILITLLGCWWFIWKG